MQKVAYCIKYKRLLKQKMKNLLPTQKTFIIARFGLNGNFCCMLQEKGRYRIDIVIGRCSLVAVTVSVLDVIYLSHP